MIIFYQGILIPFREFTLRDGEFLAKCRDMMAPNNPPPQQGDQK